MWRRLAAFADRKNGERRARYENRLDARARGRHGERRTLVGLRLEDKCALHAQVDREDGTPARSGISNFYGIDQRRVLELFDRRPYTATSMPDMATPLVPVDATAVGVSGRLGIELLLILPS
jgi:hypothetical protein